MTESNLFFKEKCPKCLSKDITMIKGGVHPKNMFNIVEEYEQYRCNKCGYDFQVISKATYLGKPKEE